jgi:hypothetical protein
MKTPESPASTAVKAALDKLTALYAEIATLKSRLTLTQFELGQLTTQGDLENEKVITSIGRLQIFTSLFPGRITAREDSIRTLEADLLAACHDFCGKTLRPFLADLMVRTRIQVGAALKGHLKGEALERAVSTSDSVQEIEGFDWVATLHQRDGEALVSYANDLLNCWNKAQAINGKL